MDLTKIKDPKFLKALSYQELEELSAEIRNAIINTVSIKGGHLSSNLGVVELTVALHYVFDAPKDKIIFDVGHQCYTHKILTGRYNKFAKSLRDYRGLSGFQKRKESEYDCYEAGHSSTSISAACGFLKALELNKEKAEVISVIGDASLANGLAFEGLNNLANIKKKAIIVINDNEMAITKTSGSLTNALDKLKINNNTNLFEKFGFDYLGPIDGHNFKELITTLKKAKRNKKSVVVHVVTKKGKGYKYAENDKKGIYHGVSGFDVKKGTINDDGLTSWSEAVSSIVYDYMKRNKKMVSIAPATSEGSKLDKIFKDFKDRAIDVGICEEHAITMAGSLAINKKKPYLCIYSTFLQRGYDQLIHDVSRMNLNIVVGVDRAGIVGKDGNTHQGSFDVAMASTIPNSVIAMPKDYSDAKAIFKQAFKFRNLFFVRYPRENIEISNDKIDDIEIGKWDLKTDKNAIFSIIVSGPNYEIVKDYLKKNKIHANLVFARYYKPIDKTAIDKLVKLNKPIVVYDIYSVSKGLFGPISEYLVTKGTIPQVLNYSLPDAYFNQGSIKQILQELKLDVDSLIKTILKELKND